MSDAEVALKLLDYVIRIEQGAPLDKDRLLALYRECLAAVRGQAQ